MGYDERALAENSCNLTMFQTPFGALQLTTLPMGWTNSVSIFYNGVTHILHPEIPHVTVPYIDNVPVKGPLSAHFLPDGSFETIPKNSDIWRFIWEHFLNLNQVIQHMKYSGGTFSGYKAFLCVPKITVLGHCCTPQGQLPDSTKVEKIVNRGPCKDLHNVWSFLGTMGLCRLFIKDFVYCAHHLVKLFQKGAPFEFGLLQVAAQADLKKALLESQAPKPIDYSSPSSIILSVDTSYIPVSYVLSQSNINNPCLHYYSRFSSITLNKQEAHFSQPKLELYGLYRVVCALQLYILGLRNLVFEVNAWYIKGMLANPNIVPSASINRWIVSILMFHFTLVHIPEAFHGPDGLFQQQQQLEDALEPKDDFDDWIDQMYRFMHIINTPTQHHITQPPLSLYVSNASSIKSNQLEDLPQTQDKDFYTIIPRS